ncbi:MAG TPA: vWA domain-containing protein, partial [Thermoanaerobaculia bacterium]
AAAAVLLSMIFTGPASAQQCGPMDVVFIVDNSGSMTNVINEIQTQVGKIADSVQAASGGDYQFGLISMPANDVDVLLDLGTNNRTALDAAVKQMSAISSSGAGIAYDEALNTVLNHLGPRKGSIGQQTGTFAGQFRASASKIIMVITDTGPQGFDDAMGTHDQNAHQMALLASKNDVHITSIFVPTGGGVDPAIDRPILQDLATTSGGLFKETKPDASDLSDVIVDIVKACGGAAGSAGSQLLIEPQEIVLTNGETGQVHITNFAPSKNETPTQFTATPAEEGQFVTSFQPVATPAVAGTEETDLSITVGPDTFQGTHLIAVQATANGHDDFAIIHVIVDCQPPFFLSRGQPQSQTVKSGATTVLNAVPGGDGPFHFQWFRGHTGITSFPIPGATLQQLTTDPATTPGEFWVRVSNACGSRDSATAVITPQ